MLLIDKVKIQDKRLVNRIRSAFKVIRSIQHDTNYEMKHICC